MYFLDLKGTANTLVTIYAHFQGITNNIYGFGRPCSFIYTSTHISTRPYSYLPILMTSGRVYIKLWFLSRKCIVCVERLSDSGLFTGTTESVTATVELNAIAMKRGELAEYRPMEMPQPQFYPPPSLDFRGMYNQRWVTSGACTTRGG